MDIIDEIELSNHLEEINKISRYIDELGKELKLPDKVVMEINLAIDEIITNIVSYAYNDNKEHKILIKISRTENFIIIVTEDDGIPFNPLDVPEADTVSILENKKIGGLGIHLVRKLMDKLEYSRADGKNILTFGKRLL